MLALTALSTSSPATAAATASAVPAPPLFFRPLQNIKELQATYENFRELAAKKQRFS